MLSKCLYGGGQQCQNQGGSGSVFHVNAYTHPHSRQLAKALTTNSKVVKGSALEEWFDDDVAKAVLSLDISASISPEQVVQKSLYDFNITTPEGIDKLLYLLPLVSDDILKLVAQEIWPGYAADDSFDQRKARLEIKGFLLDFLEDNAIIPEEITATTQPTGSDVSEEPGQEDQTAQAAPNQTGDEPSDDQQPSQ